MGISAKELRIGNWVQFKDGSTYHKVEGMCDAVVKDDRNIKLYGNGIANRGAQLFGIPLTPEILEKCGFEKQLENAGNLVCWKKGKLTIAVWLKNKWQCWIGSIDLYKSPQNLHQLQNLYYSLTSEELTYTP